MLFLIDDGGGGVPERRVMRIFKRATLFKYVDPIEAVVLNEGSNRGGEHLHAVDRIIVICVTSRGMVELLQCG